MHEIFTKDLESIDELLTLTKAEALAFLHNIDQRPVAKLSAESKPSLLPEKGIGTKAVLSKFKSDYFHLLSGSAGPRYLGFVTGGATPASISGDWLTTAIDQNLSNFGESVAPELELQTIKLLLELFDLPKSFSGTFVTGATMSNFVGLAQARQWVAQQDNIDVSKEGIYGLPAIKVLSASAHSSCYKSLSMLGMGKHHLVQIEMMPGRECIDIQRLENYLAHKAGEPCIVIGNAGTVNTVDFDNLQAIGKLKDRHRFWFHVDAAFGAFAACSPSHKHLMNGIQMADSITIDAHKWLNVPYDCAMQFSQHPKLQLEVFQNSAAYLGEIGKQPDFVHLTPENSRRFRALPVWFSLMAYGKSGYQDIVERNIASAHYLTEKIDRSSAFKCLAPTRLNVVCFSIAATNVDVATNKQFLKLLAGEGKVFMTPTIYEGKPGIRAAFSNWRTTINDVEIVWNSMLEVYKKLNQ